MSVRMGALGSVVAASLWLGACTAGPHASGPNSKASEVDQTPWTERLRGPVAHVLVPEPVLDGPILEAAGWSTESAESLLEGAALALFLQTNTRDSLPRGVLDGVVLNGDCKRCFSGRLSREAPQALHVRSPRLTFKPVEKRSTESTWFREVPEGFGRYVTEARNPFWLRLTPVAPESSSTQLQARFAAAVDETGFVAEHELEVAEARYMEVSRIEMVLSEDRTRGAFKIHSNGTHTTTNRWALRGRSMLASSGQLSFGWEPSGRTATAQVAVPAELKPQSQAPERDKYLRNAAARAHFMRFVEILRRRLAVSSLREALRAPYVDGSGQGGAAPGGLYASWQAELGPGQYVDVEFATPLADPSSVPDLWQTYAAVLAEVAEKACETLDEMAVSHTEDCGELRPQEAHWNDEHLRPSAPTLSAKLVSSNPADTGEENPNAAPLVLERHVF